MVIMAILMAIGTASFTQSQAVGRDKKRTEDVAILARHLEAIHRHGQVNGTLIYPPNTSYDTVPLGYPSTKLVSDTTDPQTITIFKGLSTPLKAPKATTDFSLVAATNLGDTSSITPLPSNSNDVYVYQPIAQRTLMSGPVDLLCTDASSTEGEHVITTQLGAIDSATTTCIKFNIYYWSEAKQAVQVLRSINR